MFFFFFFFHTTPTSNLFKQRPSVFGFYDTQRNFWNLRYCRLCIRSSSRSQSELVQEQTVCILRFLSCSWVSYSFVFKGLSSLTCGFFFCNYLTSTINVLAQSRNYYFFRLVTSATNAYDESIMNFSHTLPQWTRYFNNPTLKRINLINAMQVRNFYSSFNSFVYLILTLQYLGSLNAFPISPYVADGLGRRTSIFIGALMMCIASVIQTSATSLGMLLIARYGFLNHTLSQGILTLVSVSWLVSV